MQILAFVAMFKLLTPSYTLRFFLDPTPLPNHVFTPDARKVRFVIKLTGGSDICMQIRSAHTRTALFIYVRKISTYYIVHHLSPIRLLYSRALM